MSFARRSSKLSLRSRLSSACSSFVRPGSSAGVDVRLLDPEAQRLGSKRSADPVCSTARKPNCTRLPIKPAYCGRGLP